MISQTHQGREAKEVLGQKMTSTTQAEQRKIETEAALTSGVIAANPRTEHKAHMKAEDQDLEVMKDRIDGKERHITLNTGTRTDPTHTTTQDWTWN